MKVVVIGAGVIGAAIADALMQRGVSVTVLDMRSPGRGASQASAGILAPYIEAHEDTPLLALGTRSLDLFDAFVAGVAARSGVAIECARRGTLDVALDVETEARLRASMAWLASRGVAHEWLEDDALRAFEPSVSRSARGGLQIHTHGWVGVSSFITALVQSARLTGTGARFETPVEAVAIDPTAGGIDVRAGDRMYRADFVVIASGSWSGRIKIGGVRPLPMRPVRGQLLHLQWPSTSALPQRVVWGPRCYTVPWTDGSLLVGATVEDVGFDERTTVAGVHELTDGVAQLLPDARQATVTAVRAGLRPALPDGLPAIGPWPSDPRIVAATGHYRNGILLAPLTAQLVERYIVDGVVDPAFDVTSPARFNGV